MVARFPEFDPALIDLAAENEMDVIMEAIGGVRTIRGEADIGPGPRLPVVIFATGAESREIILRHRPWILKLAGAEGVDVRESGERPAGSLAQVTDRMEVVVPLAGVIDVEAERARQRKRLQKALAELSGVERKLANQDFLSRAPAEVVEKERDRRDELARARQRIEENLRRLAG
jgi:valyl-tRNA synthetase